MCSLEFNLMFAQIQLLHPQAKLQWKRCADMPIDTFRMQAVVIGEKVYASGGYIQPAENLTAVLMYDLVKDEWDWLPDHCMGVGLCQFQGNLLAVGGLPAENKVYRYNEETRKWEEFLTPMPTARFYLSVLTTATDLIACGGRNSQLVPVATVEVYSSQTSQWYTADPLPKPCWMMSPVIIGGNVFFLGGFNICQEDIVSPFQADIALLIERATSPIQHPTTPSTTTSVWKTLPDTPLGASPAATLSGSLLAVGGINDDQGLDIGSPAIHVFVPFTNKWERVHSGDLPTARYMSTVVQLPNNRVMVVGGKDSSGTRTTTNFIGCLAI